MRNTIYKLYPNLAAQERFQLVLAALARGDKEEMRRLAETCPRKSYSMREAAFVDLVEVSREIAGMFAILWLEASRRYLAAELVLHMYREAVAAWSRGYIEGVNWGWQQVGGEGVLLEDGDRISTGPSEQLEALCRQRAATLKGIYQGFIRFCQAVLLSPEKLLAWYPFVLADVEAARGVLESQIPADEEAEKKVSDLFLSLWPGG